jgi:outer membrane protein assembly factor BamB
LFRRDARNTGSSPISGDYAGDRPWFLQTGKGIFSTPIIDAEGVIYVGSGDHSFYALNPDGSQRWRVKTGEIIDSAAALPAGSPATILVPSGDGYLYRLRTRDGDLVWRFDARVAPRDSYNNWFEANVSLGPDGTIYAGNTNFNYYAITPAGDLKWVYETGSNAWSAAAFSPDGSLTWGSCDTFFHHVSPEGRLLWRKRTLGFIAASVAVGSDGTLYAGAFDATFYALDPDIGKARWTFQTQDHIYGSAALLEENGETLAILFGAADGLLYALSPDGDLMWRFDTGAPIRSSPVIGRAPTGEPGQIVYFGNGDGILFALDAQTGRRRWSYDTTGAGDALPDRNDLNGSPALGEGGVFIGGEHGQLWYVPYDYPLRHPEDPRGSMQPDEDLPADGAGLYYVTPGGRAQPAMPATLPAATAICFKLVVRENGETVPARFYNLPFFRRQNTLQIAFDPPVACHWEPSGDGRFLTIIPDGFLQPGVRYTLRARGSYHQGGLRLGNLKIGGRTAGRFDQTLHFTVETPALPKFPLAIDVDRATALELTRMAVPIPPMLTSLNQIGFDYMHWLMGPVAIKPPAPDRDGQLVLWAVGARRDAEGRLVVDPDTDFRLPLSGPIREDAFILANRNFKMAITGIPIPFNLFQIRGRLGADRRVLPGATATAETQVLSIPTFGLPMVIAGLANRIWQKLVAMATFITAPYDDAGPACRRPAGVTIDAVSFQPPGTRRDGLASAQVRVADGHAYPARAHLSAILLLDREGTDVVTLDYHNNLSQTADAQGNLRRIDLRVPRGTRLPATLTAVVLLDVFPVYEARLR